MMNERPNHFRRVPYAESEASHLFKVLRHFPDLAKSHPEIEQMQVQAGRNWHDKTLKKKEKARPIKHTSTRRLDQLTKSALHENPGHMDDIRKVLLISRNPSMTARFDRKQLEPLDSFSRFGSQSNDGMEENRLLLGEADVPILIGKDNLNPLTPQARGPESASRLSKRASSSYGKTPLEVANAKLTKAALSFTAAGEVNPLKGFQGQDLNMEEFNVQLRRCMQINLKKKELKALFGSMDADDSGLIDGVEFTRYFFTLGNVARNKLQVELVASRRREVDEEMRQRVEDDKRMKDWESSHISDLETITTEDEARVFSRLADVALKWDSTSNINALKLVGFNQFLTPFQFKVQCERSFDMKLNRQDCGALLRRYKTNEQEACVDGKAFLQSFSKLRRESAHEHKKILKKLAKRRDRVKAMNQAPTYYECLGR